MQSVRSPSPWATPRGSKHHYLIFARSRADPPKRRSEGVSRITQKAAGAARDGAGEGSDLGDRSTVQYGYGVVEVGGGFDELLAAGWTTCQVNLWPLKASMTPSPVTFLGFSSVNVYSRSPL